MSLRVDPISTFQRTDRAAGLTSSGFVSSKRINWWTLPVNSSDTHQPLISPETRSEGKKSRPRSSFRSPAACKWIQTPDLLPAVQVLRPCRGRPYPFYLWRAFPIPAISHWYPFPWRGLYGRSRRAPSSSANLQSSSGEGIRWQRWC